MLMPLHLRVEQCIWDIVSFRVVSLHKIQYHVYLPSYYELFSFNDESSSGSCGCSRNHGNYVRHMGR